MSGRKEAAYFDLAQRLYCQENKTLEAIREHLQGEVSITTLCKWKLKGGWAAHRQAALTSPKTLAEKLRRILERQIEAAEAEQRLNPGAFDAIYKTFKAIEKLEKVQDLRVLAVEAMQAFTEWLKIRELPAGELQLIGGRIREWFRSLE